MTSYNEDIVTVDIALLHCASAYLQSSHASCTNIYCFPMKLKFHISSSFVTSAVYKIDSMHSFCNVVDHLMKKHAT